MPEVPAHSEEIGGQGVVEQEVLDLLESFATVNLDCNRGIQVGDGLYTIKKFNSIILLILHCKIMESVRLSKNSNYISIISKNINLVYSFSSFSFNNLKPFFS